MKLTDTILDLIKFRTETGNATEIDKCLAYCEKLFENSGAIVTIFRSEKASPVLFIRNVEANEYDALCLGHLDVVPADDSMFNPVIKDGKLFGRGSLDMKSFAAVAFNSMFYVLENKLPIKFAVILSTDEEKGSASTHAFMEAHPDLKAKIVLDNDVGGDISKLVTKCKNPVFVKLIAEGKEAHGSTPWDGIDANEKLMLTWHNIRKIYPYYSKNGNIPADKWIDTVHVAKLHGGEVSNVICGETEALLDFRLTENSNVDNLCKNLDSCMIPGVSYKIVSESTPVVMPEDNKYILEYKQFAENIMGEKIEFEHIGGATDSRAFAVNYNGSNTTITMNLKDLIGIQADTNINETILAQAAAVGADCFVSLEGLAKVMSNPQNGMYFDQITNQIWFVNTIQRNTFNVLATTRTKVPQTDAGLESIMKAIRNVCVQAVTNGMLAPGEWNSNDYFGTQEDFLRNIREFGYYIYHQPVAEQAQSEREQRKAPQFQVAAKEAGAVHSENILVYIEA